MADYSTYNQSATPGVGDSPKKFAENAIADIDILKRRGLGDTLTSLPNGHLQATDVGGGRIGFQVTTANGLKNSLAGEYLLQEDLDCNLKEMVKMLLERLGTIPGASAANESRIGWDETKELAFLIGTTLRHYVAQCNIAGTTYISIPLIVDTEPATNPTTLTKNAIKGFLFDAVGEQLGLTTQLGIPDGWMTTVDCEIELTVALNQIESNNDDIDFKIVTWQSVDTPAENFAKATSGPSTPTPHDIGTASADGDVHRVRIPVPRADGTNPTVKGAAARYIIERDDLLNVGGVHFSEARLLIPVQNFNHRQD